MIVFFLWKGYNEMRECDIISMNLKKY